MFWTTAKTLEKISFIVALCVVIGMTIVFSALFYSSSKHKIKLIHHGIEDENIKRIIYSGFEKDKKSKNVAEYAMKYNENENKLKLISDIIYNLVFLFFLGVIIFSASFRCQGEEFYLGNTTYLIIQTNSMETKNPSHLYYEDLPNNQIEQLSLVGISKVKQKDLKLYDIIAFRYDDKIYVHRIVRISEKDGVLYYTTQGDANGGTLTFETDLTFDKIIGKYNNFQSIELGLLLTYFESNIGIISLLFGLLFVAFVGIFDGKVQKKYVWRIEILFRPLLIPRRIHRIFRRPAVQQLPFKGDNHYDEKK